MVDIKEFLTIDNGFKIGFKITGEGQEYILCFHGFGEQAEVFDDVHKAYPGYQVIAFDLPFHGSTEVPNEHITPGLWRRIIQQFCKDRDIASFHLISYSLGGRFLIRTVCDFPELVKSCQIVASDGFHYTFWYKFAVSWIGNIIFKHQMKNPHLFFQLCDLLDRYRLINPSMTKFARLQLQSKDQRIKVYNSWTYLKHLRTPIRKFAKAVNRYKIPVDVYVGTKDYIIKESFFDQFIELTGSTKHVLKARHHEMIGKWLKNPKEL